jgi:hypothetical protein
LRGYPERKAGSDDEGHIDRGARLQ